MGLSISGRLSISGKSSRSASQDEKPRIEIPEEQKDKLNEAVKKQFQATLDAIEQQSEISFNYGECQRKIEEKKELACIIRDLSQGLISSLQIDDSKEKIKYSFGHFSFEAEMDYPLAEKSEQRHENSTPGYRYLSYSITFVYDIYLDDEKRDNIKKSIDSIMTAREKERTQIVLASGVAKDKKVYYQKTEISFGVRICLPRHLIPPRGKISANIQPKKSWQFPYIQTINQCSLVTSVRIEMPPLHSATSRRTTSNAADSSINANASNQSCCPFWRKLRKSKVPTTLALAALEGSNRL